MPTFKKQQGKQKQFERSHISNLLAHLKALEQKGEIVPEKSGWQEIIKFRAEIDKRETNKQTKIIERTNEVES